MPLTNTCPASISSMKRARSARSRVHTLRRGRRACRWRARSPRRCRRRGTAPRPGRTALRRYAGSAWRRCRRGPSARRSCPARSSGAPPVSTRAPAATDRSHLLVEIGERSAGVASGPIVSVRPSDRRRSALRMRCDERVRRTRRRLRSATMKRLAAMQDWPLLIDARLHRGVRRRRRGRRSA